MEEGNTVNDHFLGDSIKGIVIVSKVHNPSYPRAELQGCSVADQAVMLNIDKIQQKRQILSLTSPAVEVGTLSHEQTSTQRLIFV
jgi:hypothetical protein